MTGISLRVIDLPPVILSVRDADSATWHVGEYVPMVPTGLPTYDGDYTVTPSDEAQVLATSGAVMTGDLTIAPIPSNYGLITWDGAILRVS